MEENISPKYSLKNKIMEVLTKKKSRKLSVLKKNKVFKMNTLTPYFKFKNKLGKLEVVRNCYILI